MKTRWLLTVGLLFPLAAGAQSAQPKDTALEKRWVGNYLERPLTLEFYGDTMLVVGDRHALDYRLTGDSLIANGDTTIRARYRLAYGRLLLEVPDGNVITMAPQRTLGRQLTGHWIGSVDSAGTAIPVELNLYNDRTACWRVTPDGKWMRGEWDRDSRTVTMIWDNGEWIGRYDPQGNALVLKPAVDSSQGTTPSPAGTLQHAFRGPAGGSSCVGSR